jgi:membrane associated rhomboid family serine protease
VIIPIGHDQSVRRMPWLTLGIIALCTLIQIYSSFFAPSEQEIANQLLAIEYQLPEVDPDEDPAAYEQRLEDVERHVIAIANKIPQIRWGYQTGSGLSYKLVTSGFLHAGWFHLIGNMLFLWLAGSALEDRYGRMRFAAFYVVGTAFATLAFEVVYNGPGTTLVGASGAISACMGAFLVHFRKTQITFWYLFGRASGTFRLSAYVALPLWLADQVISKFVIAAMGMVSAIAYEAHIGGFIAGVGLGYASSKLFPQDAADDDVEYEPVAAPPPQTDAQLDERIAKCLAALQQRDIATVRTMSSRVILDLARVRNDGRIIDLYRELAKQLDKPPLTDGAFAAVATAADNLGDKRTFAAVAQAMLDQHGGSGQLPKVLWRLAQIHREAGQHEQQAKVLQTIAQRFPKDPLAEAAKRELERSAGIALD